MFINSGRFRNLFSNDESIHSGNPFDQIRSWQMIAATGDVFGENNNGNIPSSLFDEDFAESISKPLPQWYRDSKGERENILKDIEKNRERILKEFKAKYEVTEEEKAQELNIKWEKIKQRVKDRKNKFNWLEKIKSIIVTNHDEELALLNDDEILHGKDATTKEKWEKFWEDEEKQTGFSLPGFFEVFPELQLKWPKWGLKKDGSSIDCERDEDCPFPQACCPHPIIPGQKFCCTGWGQRIMVPAYARQEISSNFDDLKDNNKDEDASWGKNNNF